jgi:multidrug efflux pump subunit AcrA (membrane-fusion protein)
MMELRLSLEPGHWFIGEAVTVELPDAEPRMSLSVPRDALVLRDDEIFVYTISKDNKAIKIPVSPGSGLGTRIAIEADLKAGDPVVVRGAERLNDGQSVKVTQHHLAASRPAS